MNTIMRKIKCIALLWLSLCMAIMRKMLEAVSRVVQQLTVRGCDVVGFRLEKPICVRPIEALVPPSAMAAG